MGSVVSESLSSVAKSLDQRVKMEADPRPLDSSDLRALARSIIDKEPCEIRALLRRDPDLVVGWVSQLKTEQLQASAKGGDLHEALDHIRLSTLSPLKFAAE